MQQRASVAPTMGPPDLDARARAVAAVEEYGAAWSSQDAARISRLFSPDAVYVERPGDESGIFRGRAAIESYWRKQIGTQQQNIRFRQLDRELLWDGSKHTALAKWEAAFDKRRRDGSLSPCQFVQVAVLRFASDESGQIEYLEEYWHSTSKQRRVDGPGPEPEKLLEPGPEPEPEPEPQAEAALGAAASAPAAATCGFCGAQFAARNQLFAHLRGEDGLDPCASVPAEDQGRIPASSSQKSEKFALVIGHTAAAAAGEHVARAVSVSPRAI